MIVMGYPKSGNTWFCYLLAYSLNVEYDNLMEPGVHPRDPYQRKLVKGGLPHKSSAEKTKGVWCTHSFKTFREYLNKKDFSIYLVRDGRDVMVSYYYYLNKFLVEERKQTNPTNDVNLPVTTDTDEADKFSLFVKKRSLEWKEHVRVCLAEKPDMVVRYEDLQSNPEETLKTIFSKLGAEVEDKVIDSALSSFSFEVLAGREKGREDNSSFFRKGIVGDWKNKFREEDVKTFMETAGDVLADLGYITE